MMKGVGRVGEGEDVIRVVKVVGKEEVAKRVMVVEVCWWSRWQG